MSIEPPPAIDTCELRIAADHPAFTGHFPGRPLLPGAVLLDAALHAIVRKRRLDLAHWRVASAKFLQTVRPGDALTLDHWAPDAGTIRFTVRTGQHAVAAGMLSAGAATPDRHGA